jgi:glycosyltransferase involved in cell wall biosynthesis
MKNILKKILNHKVLTYNEAKSKFQIILKKTDNDVLETEKELNKQCKKSKKNCLKYKKAFFVLIKDIDLKLAVKYGEEIIQKEFDESFINVLAVRYKRIGNEKRYQQLKNKLSLLPNIRKRLKELLNEERKFHSIEKYINLKISEFPDFELEIKKLSFALLKDIYTKEVIPYGKYVDNLVNDEKFKKVLEKRKSTIKSVVSVDKTQAFKIDKFKLDLISLIDEENLLNIEIFIDKNIEYFPKKKVSIYKTAFSLLKDNYTSLSLKYGDIVLKFEEDIKFIKVLLARAKRIKDIEKIYKYSTIIYKMDKNEDVFGNIIEYENKDLLEELSLELKNDNNKIVDKNLKNLLEKYKDNKDKIYYLFGEIYYQIDKQKAIELLEEGLKFKESDTLYLKLFEFYIQQGNIAQAIKSMPEDTTNKTLINKINIWKSNLELLNNGFKFEDESKSIKYTPTNNIFYLLHNSLPFHSGGYATRAHGLMEGANSLSDFQMQGVSRLGYPKDILKLESDKDITDSETIDEILYHRLKSDTRRGSTTYYNYIKEYAQAVVELAQKEKPFVIHAASNLYNGLACVYAAKLLGVKSVYEVRGLWEITRISREPEWKDTDMYRFNADMETTAALNADVVITITQALKDEMVSRGVPADKIEILPNGVVSERFKPLERNEKLAKELNIENKTVLGFIGSFVQYEGLEYIVDAVEILVKDGKTEIIALMVGDGAVWQEIKDKVTQKGLDEYFIFTGRIPHEEVEEYYSLVDIAPLPRKGLPVCEMVSPLKPFEAMAMEKVVLSSDVAALAEIVDDGFNGILFKKDNVEDLAKKIDILMQDKDLRIKLGKQARDWVVKERDWKVLSNKLVNIYDRLKG